MSHRSQEYSLHRYDLPAYKLLVCRHFERAEETNLIGQVHIKTSCKRSKECVPNGQESKVVKNKVIKGGK